MDKNGDLSRYKWPTKHRILGHVTKGELQSLGCLEYPPAKPSTLQEFIHPLFARDRWKNLNTSQYECLKPGLVLATALIGKPQLLHYWYALLLGPRKIVQERVKREGGGSYTRQNHSFHAYRDPSSQSAVLTEDMMIQTALAFCQLSRTTSFSFSWECGTTPSIIRRVSARSPPFPERSRFGSASDVYINIGHFGALRNAGFSTSQQLRAQFLFAVTVVHAVAHVGNIAIQNQPKHVLEPYFEDDGQAEPGLAWAEILNGLPRCAVDTDFGSSYGLVWRRFPFSHEVPSPARQTTSSSNWTTNWFTPTQFVADVVSRDFWGPYGVDRYGPEMLKQPRMFGVREYSKSNPRHTRPRPLSSSDMDPRQGEGPNGLRPQAIKLWERVPEENWDLDGDVVMSDILATLRVERRVRDLDGDIIMRDASNSPIQGTSFPWTSSIVGSTWQGRDSLGEWRNWKPHQLY